jgi:hypothetical protein
METGSVVPVGDAFKQMLEDYYSGNAPLPVYRPFVPLQWVELKDLEKPFPPERFYATEHTGITEKQITDLMKEMERVDDTERKG